MTEVTRSFCWHQNFVSWGLYSPALGLYTCIKSWKKLYKIRLQRDFFETCNKWVKVISPFCWHQNFVPWGLSAPAPGLYTCIKSWKNLYKIRLQRDFLKLATSEWSDEILLLTSKLCPLGAVCPCPGAIYIYKIMKKIVLSQTSKRFFLNLQQMTEATRGFCWHHNFVPWGCLPLPAAIYIY